MRNFMLAVIAICALWQMGAPHMAYCGGKFTFISVMAGIHYHLSPWDIYGWMKRNDDECF